MKSGDGNPPPRHKAATEAEIEAQKAETQTGAVKS